MIPSRRYNILNCINRMFRLYLMPILPERRICILYCNDSGMGGYAAGGGDSVLQVCPETPRSNLKQQRIMLLKCAADISDMLPDAGLCFGGIFLFNGV